MGGAYRLAGSGADERLEAPETGARREFQGAASAERPDITSQEQRGLSGRKMGTPYSSWSPKLCGIVAKVTFAEIAWYYCSFSGKIPLCQTLLASYSRCLLSREYTMPERLRVLIVAENASMRQGGESRLALQWFL